MSSVTYIRHPNKRYMDNPFIEALGLPLTQKEFVALTEVNFEDGLDLSNVDEERYGSFTRTLIDNLADVYVVRDEAYRLYDAIHRMIEAGYVKRNPLRGDVRKILAAIETDAKDPLKQVNTANLDLASTQQSFSVIGLSGIGKTMLVKQTTKVFESVIEHTEYVNSRGKIERVNASQIPVIYVEIPDGRGQKAVLLDLLAAIDSKTGEEYGHIYRNKTVYQLILAARKAVITHGVGLIVFDEAQNFVQSSKKETVGSNEKTSMKFVESLFNRLGVPLLYVGTFSTLKVMAREMTAARRAVKNGSFTFKSCEVESSFWIRFIKTFCQTQVLQNQRTDLDTIRCHAHYLSVGIPAIAASLIRATLCYLTFLPAKDQDLSIKALDLVFEEQFKILQPALRALRKGDYHKYEDFEPMLMLEETDLVPTQEDIVVTKIEQFEQKVIEGAVKLKSARNCQLESNARKEAEKVAPENLLGTLGYHSPVSSKTD